MHNYDIIVAGAGLAGKVAAAVLGTAGYRVACCDPIGNANAGSRNRDNRLTALLKPAMDILRMADVWDAVCDAALPLPSLRVIDSSGGVPGTAISHDFESSDIGEECFGWTVLNSSLHDILDRRISEIDNVVMLHGNGVNRTMTRRNDVVCTLSGGGRAFARLLVAADGRNSAVREQVGVSLVKTPGTRSALSFNLHHSTQHDAVATEIYGSGESITLVPFPGADNQNESSVVWVMDSVSANQLNLKDDSKFELRLQEFARGRFGDVVAASARILWPVSGQIALQFGTERVVLIGEAAHVLSPVGAQGFNTTLSDVAVLAASIAKCGQDPGSRQVVGEYSRIRRADALLRLCATDALGSAGTSRSPLIQQARKMCLAALHRNDRMRKRLMTFGMGGPQSVGPLPRME